MDKIVLSTSFLPPIEYFYYLLKGENIIIEQHETYKKQTYRNRCVIYTEKGEMNLSIPIIKPNGNHSKTHSIEIYYDEYWQKKHWRAICSAYQASPYFLYYKDDLEFIFQKKIEKLIDLNMHLINKLAELIKMDINICYTDSFLEPRNLENDLRFKISPKTPSTIKNFPPYTQVFSDRHGFLKNLSIIDLLFNLGPETLSYLRSMES